MPLNKPLTREDWLTYLDTTWKKCLADAWQKEWDDMNRDDIIKMAREAGFNLEHGFLLRVTGIDEDLERFAALVRADERNRTWTQEHWTEYERSIAAAEREVCAKVADLVAREMDDTNGIATYIAAALRARGQT
jgi:hypothetical protein